MYEPARIEQPLWPFGILFLASVAVLAAVTSALWIAGPKFLDDGYYYLQIAWHASQGNGTTFDGINQTNGFHPLWLFMLITVFWTGMGKTSALYVATLLQTAFFIGSGWALYGVLRRLACTGFAIVGGCVWLLNAWLWNKAAISGMETGLLVFCFGTSFWLFVRQLKKETSPWQLGIALACLTAARIDSVPLAIGMLLAISVRQGLRTALHTAAPSLIYLVAYLAINITIFGSPLPISGYIKSSGGRVLLIQFLMSGRLEFFHHAWRNITNFLSLGGRIPLAIPLVLLAGGLLAVAWLPGRTQRTVLGVCVFYAFGFFGYYTFMYESLIEMYTYYFIPVFYAGIMSAFIMLSQLPRKWNWLRLSGTGLVALATLVFNGMYIPDQISSAAFTVPYEQNPQYMAIAYINSNLPPDAIVGCWDAGMIGYNANKPVVNLDGLVNNYDFINTIRKEGMAAYLERQNVSYLINYDDVRRRLIEEELSWDFVCEFSRELPHIATRFSIAPTVQSAKRQTRRTYYVYKKPASKS